MIDNVNKIKSIDFDTIKSDGVLTMLLLKTYSVLYKGGKQVRTCINSQRKYYNEILKTGIMKAELKEKVEKRTCEPKFKGRKEVYTNKGIYETHSEHLTDESAISFLKIGWLKESDFKTLPKGWDKIKKEMQKEKAKAEAETKKIEEAKILAELKKEEEAEKKAQILKEKVATELAEEKEKVTEKKETK